MSDSWLGAGATTGEETIASSCTRRACTSISAAGKVCHGIAVASLVCHGWTSSSGGKTLRHRLGSVLLTTRAAMTWAG